MDDANPSHDRLLSLLRWLAAFEGVDDRKTGKVFSQNAEDGIIQHIFGRIGTESKTYVELGVQDGRECNTRHLRVKHNWTGLMIDGGFHKSEINLQRHFITTANVVSLLEKYGFRSSKKLDLLPLEMMQEAMLAYACAMKSRCAAADVIFCVLDACESCTSCRLLCGHRSPVAPAFHSRPNAEPVCSVTLLRILCSSYV